MTLAALRAEGVAAPSPYYLENTGALIHRMDPASVQTAAEPFARTVRIQIISPPGALTRDAQKQLVKDATGIMADICVDPSLAKRTWVLLTEAEEGGWGNVERRHRRAAHDLKIADDHETHAMHGRSTIPYLKRVESDGRIRGLFVLEADARVP